MTTAENRCRTCGGDGIEPNGRKTCSTCGGSGGAPLPRRRAEDRALVEGLERIGVLSREPQAQKARPAGSSPALEVVCPVDRCGAAAGEYCTRETGGRQIIAHKKRRELAMREYADYANNVFRGLAAKREAAKREACPASLNFTGGDGTHKFVSDGKCLWCHQKKTTEAVVTRVRS